MPIPSITLRTLGYEGKTLDSFLSSLERARVDRLIDVRALPLSRRQGFSKRGLFATLANVGIEYVHLKIAGNPYRALKGDPTRCLALYARHLDEHPEVMLELERTVGASSALMCAEANALACHRSILAARWRDAAPGREVVHLGMR